MAEFGIRPIENLVLKWRIRRPFVIELYRNEFGPTLFCMHCPTIAEELYGLGSTELLFAQLEAMGIAEIHLNDRDRHIREYAEQHYEGRLSWEGQQSIKRHGQWRRRFALLAKDLILLDADPGLANMVVTYDATPVMRSDHCGLAMHFGVVRASDGYPRETIRIINQIANKNHFAL